MFCKLFVATIMVWLMGFCMMDTRADDSATPIAAPDPGCIRVATYNVALNRKTQGALADDLKKGDEQASKVSAVIQLVAPDILLLNELDQDSQTALLFVEKYLGHRQPHSRLARECRWEHFYSATVNTGIDSGLDLNRNNRLHESDDGWGYGAFPGQYGMLVVSRFPIIDDRVRTFQNFRWSQMPGALRPKMVDKETGKEKFYHEDTVWEQLRLSSKSHWDVPITVDGQTLHLIASHPTPPVFDGPEDRNGRRNHDEIRMLRDYISGSDAGSYLLDDAGHTGGLDARAHFVILGDLNSDPNDGSGIASAIRELLDHPRIAKCEPPSSLGAASASLISGNANAKHRGNPAHDTGDFNDKGPGNLRIDFVLPSANCAVVASGVYWPSPEEDVVGAELATASDHHLVWVDIRLE
jgi:endonuclease/exonuclease/phosphatase family metal-dependent hydrolase